MKTLSYRIEREFMLLSLIGAFIGLFFFLRSQNLLPKPDIVLSMPVSFVDTKPTITPILKITTVSQISPDGTKKVILKALKNNDNTQTYTFSTADGSGQHEQVFLSKVLDASKSMSIPFNSWSPDNKYFFIEEDSENEKDVKVFMDSHNTFSDGNPYLDVTQNFALKKNTNNFKEATGWASETLIIVNTTTENGTKGPSYWFEVPSKAIIQLATEF